MKKVLKTVTLGTIDNPNYSICPGHVNAKTFAEAFSAEGWSDTDADSWELTHEFWIKQKRAWKKSTKGAKDSAGRKAQPVTVGHW